MWAHLWTSVHSIQYWYKVRKRRWDWILSQSICHVPSTWLDNKRRVILLWQTVSLHILTLHYTYTNKPVVGGQDIHWPYHIITTYQAHHPYLSNPLEVKEKETLHLRPMLQRLTHCSLQVQNLISSLIPCFVLLCTDYKTKTGLQRNKEPLPGYRNN